MNIILSRCQMRVNDLGKTQIIFFHEKVLFFPLHIKKLIVHMFCNYPVATGHLFTETCVYVYTYIYIYIYYMCI